MADEKAIKALLTEEAASQFENYRRSLPKKDRSRTKAGRRLIRAALDDFFRFSGEHQSYFLETIERHLSEVRKLKELEDRQFQFLVRDKRLIVRTSVVIDNYRRIDEYIEKYNSFANTIKTKSEAYSSLINLAIDPDKPWPNG